jgi:hypothetical protein
MCQYYFSFICLASGQTIIDDWYITGYNLIFTALPLCIRAVTDSDININNKMIMKNLALLYKENRDEYKIFNFKTFIIYLFKGSVISLFIYLTGFQNSMLINGLNKNIWYISLSSYICILIVASMNLLITSNFIIILLPLSILITTFFLFGIFLIMNHYGLLFIFNSKASVETSFSSLQFYIVIILISCFNFILDYSMKLFAVYFNDSLSSRLILYSRERKKKNSLSRNRNIKYSNFYQDNILKGLNDNDFEKSKNLLMPNKSLNKINIINNNNRYLNFNILPSVNVKNQNELNNLPEIQNIRQKFNDNNIFDYNDIYNEINNDNYINNENENKDNEFEEDEKE